ncbi:hypothetical protein P175DRAFT_0378321 [Aspergillus ochraceoroseus IBT 24754]|uniref:Uncharacterized protein n=1 Tax=Aspergillus ochraceoroseus IBT 24754 TaxID=1392256 RepID=A0A2T5LNE4_9EURO|nr:uncharacterized protein P175DRAFT_0378321 [Aspergillus ochraceoroseus IBT 24754]PTU17796.1 hypothetical protein P175DRAFT_0378321 [Aspergillus ochraceoroseus IBT 24754]
MFWFRLFRLGISFFHPGLDYKSNRSSPALTSPHLTSPFLALPCLALFRSNPRSLIRMSSPNLTSSELIALCDTTRRSFSDNFIPFTNLQLEKVQKSSTLVRSNRHSIGKNAPKLRAHTVLSELWTHCPEGFILCALSTYQSRLGTLKSTDFLRDMMEWWQGVEHPGGLSAVLVHYANILPGNNQGM